MIEESRNEVTLAKVSSQPHSSYEAAATLTKFELKKIFIDKIEKSESYLTAPEHRDCYDGLKKSYEVDKDYFSSYDVYSLKQSRQDKDKDEDPSAGSDRGLKKRKRSKDAELTGELKKKDSTSGSSKSQLKSSKKFVQSEEPVFEVADSKMPQDQEGNLSDNEDEPRNETASRHDWFKKPTPPQKPTDPDWNISKTTQERPTQICPARPVFRLLKGIRSNYAKLEYNFEECYKALLEKLDWENPKGGDYPFDLSKPLPLIKSGKRQRVPFEFFINNDLKYLQGGISTMTYTTGMQSRGDVYSTKWILAVTHVSVMRKYRYGYLEEIVNRLSNLSGDDVADFYIALRMFTRSLVIKRKRQAYTPYKDPKGFIYVDDFGRNRLMRSDELYKFCDGTLTRLLSSLEDITKNIDMTYLPKRRWSTLENKRAYFIIKDINKLLKERRMMRSLEKFVGGRSSQIRRLSKDGGEVLFHPFGLGIRSGLMWFCNFIIRVCVPLLMMPNGSPKLWSASEDVAASYGFSLELSSGNVVTLYDDRSIRSHVHCTRELLSLSRLHSSLSTSLALQHESNQNAALKSGDATKSEVLELENLGFMEDVSCLLSNLLSSPSKEIKCVESIVFSSFNPPPSYRRQTVLLEPQPCFNSSSGNILDPKPTKAASEATTLIGLL
ncbi:hypothetical protein Tco_1109323 [Tanacetum coccineum]